jgi:Phage tail sheath protein FI
VGTGKEKHREFSDWGMEKRGVGRSIAGRGVFCGYRSADMTQDDIDNGRLICIIGAAPVKPAEFVIFRIMQKTGEP